MDSTVTLIFRCGTSLVEDSFELSRTVGSVKEAIHRRLPEPISSSKLRLELAGKELMDEDQRLSEIFPKGGFVAQVILVNMLPLQSIAEPSVPRSVSPEPKTQSVPPVPVTPESVSSEPDSLDSENPLVTAIARTLALPTHRVIDELHRILSGEVQRDILISLYSSAVEECSTIEDQVQFLVSKILEMEFHDFLKVEEPFNCPVCFEDHPRSNVFEFMCGLDQDDQKGDSHALCYVCAQEHLNSFVSDGNPNMKCYGCDHILSLNEIALLLGNGSVPQGKAHPSFETIDILKRDFVVGLDPSEYAKCPTSGCSYFAARSENGAIEKVTCPRCDFTFCSNCRRVYHYRTTCAEVHQLQEAWRTWTVSGRSQYWQEDEEMRRRAEQLAGDERQRVKDVRKAEYEDEKWKAENCRHCPTCNRLVNKMDGCNAMRCGYDTDTKGNVQDGCRNKFDWTKAKPYTPVEVGANVTMIAVPQNEKRCHRFWKCDACGEDIVGLRFSCVNCASFSICERCEAEYSDHISGHFFQIVNPPPTDE